MTVWKRPDDVRTFLDFQKFHLRFKALQTLFAKICHDTILDHNILVLSTQKHFSYHLFPSQENSRKFDRFLKRPDDVRTFPGLLHVFQNFICVLNPQKQFFEKSVFIRFVIIIFWSCRHRKKIDVTFSHHYKRNFCFSQFLRRPDDVRTSSCFSRISFEL